MFGNVQYPVSRNLPAPPLALQLIKAILTISPVSIQLRNGLQIVEGVSDQHRIFVGLCCFILEPQLELILNLARQSEILFDRST